MSRMNKSISILKIFHNVSRYFLHRQINSGCHINLFVGVKIQYLVNMHLKKTKKKYYILEEKKSKHVYTFFHTESVFSPPGFLLKSRNNG